MRTVNDSIGDSCVKTNIIAVRMCFALALTGSLKFSHFLFS